MKFIMSLGMFLRHINVYFERNAPVVNLVLQPNSELCEPENMTASFSICATAFNHQLQFIHTYGIAIIFFSSRRPQLYYRVAWNTPLIERHSIHCC